MDIAKRRAELLKRTPEQLANGLINRDLNDLVSSYANYEDGDERPPDGRDKRVPYLGWYWRSVNFAEGDIIIGDCSEFIGFMERNKWDYPQRRLEPEETDQVLAIVCEAHRLDHQGGNLDDIIASVKTKLEELWPLMQSFPIKREGFWIHGVQGNVAFAETEDDADRLIESLTDAGPGFRYWKVPA